MGSQINRRNSHGDARSVYQARLDQALVITPDISSGYGCMLTHRSLFGLRSGPQLQHMRTFVVAAFALT